MKINLFVRRDTKFCVSTRPNQKMKRNNIFLSQNEDGANVEAYYFVLQTKSEAIVETQNFVSLH